MANPIDLATMRSNPMIRSMRPESVRLSDLRPRDNTDEPEEHDEPHD